MICCHDGCGGPLTVVGYCFAVLQQRAFVSTHCHAPSPSYCKSQSAPANGEVSDQYIQYDCAYSLGQVNRRCLFMFVV